MTYIPGTWGYWDQIEKTRMDHELAEHDRDLTKWPDERHPNCAVCYTLGMHYCGKCSELSVFDPHGELQNQETSICETCAQ